MANTIVSFTKDEGESADDVPSRTFGVPLPTGARNYMTPEGAAALREQLRGAQEAVDHLRGQGGSAWIAARERLVFLQGRVEALEVVKPPARPDDQVRFGATVTFVDDQDRSRTVRIVGLDEADAARGDISWTAPLARALLGRRTGDEVVLRTPQGTSQAEIVTVSYPSGR